MPNYPYETFQNPYNNFMINNPNQNQFNPFFNIENELKILNSKINELENRIEKLEKNKTDENSIYQTSMNMM